MFHPDYEDLVRFASEGSMDAELRLAKSEFVAGTGAIFESDAAYERRIGSFLEWYVFDRPTSFAAPSTPMRLYLRQRADFQTVPERRRLLALSQTVLSLFEYLPQKGASLVLRCLLTGLAYPVHVQETPAGLEPRDILEARLVPLDGRLMLSDPLGYIPREANRVVRRATQLFRRRHAPTDADRMRMIWHVAALVNRCERYRHVPPKQIFAELLADKKPDLGDGP